MPQARTYKTGSIIYFEGDKADKVYILKQGKVQTIHTSIETGVETREIIKTGEFFGVKSVLGLYPHEETIQVLSDAVVILLTPHEFENLVANNPAIIMKTLRVFSNQLRRIGKKVRSLLSEPSEVSNPTEELFKIGEFYYTNRNYREALYAYKKYIEYSGGTGEYDEDARKKVVQCKQTLGIPLSDEDKKKPKKKSDKDDFSLVSAKIGDKKEEEKGVSLKDTYFEGLNAYSKGNYEKAITVFEKALAITKIAGSEGMYYEKAMFDLGRSQYHMKQYDTAIKTLLSMVKRYSSSEDVKEAIFVIGQACEEKGDLKKALAYYNKVVTLPPKDKLTNEAKAKAAAVKEKV